MVVAMREKTKSNLIGGGFFVLTLGAPVWLTIWKLFRDWYWYSP